MPSPVVTASLQAAVLCAISNVLAQSIKAYQSATPLHAGLDPVPLVQFVLFTLVSTPPNCYWQELLESWYPAQIPAGRGGGSSPADEKPPPPHPMRLSKRNTAKKFTLDQLVGAPVNTVLFLAAMGGFRGLRGPALLEYVKQEFVPLTLAGLKLWPAVALLCFTVVPVERRVVFGSLVALGWNVYLGLVMG